MQNNNKSFENNNNFPQINLIIAMISFSSIRNDRHVIRCGCVVFRKRCKDFR